MTLYTRVLELKIAQEISIIDQEPLLLLFLDLSKAYNTMNRDRLLATMEGYGAGPRMCGPL